MGLYNFQPRFVPFILSREKTHTIRAWRSHGDVPGRTMHLYSGLRHKGARLLMRTTCVRVDFIRITADQRVFIGASVGFEGSPALYGEGQYHQGGFVELDRSEKDSLAKRDGFRNFQEMMQFWNGRLPFEGQIYHWRPPA